MDENNILKKIEEFSAEQKKYYEKLEIEINDLRDLVQLQYQHLDKRIEYVVFRLSLKERVKGLISKLLKISYKVPKGKKDIDFHSSSTQVGNAQQTTEMKTKDPIPMEDRTFINRKKEEIESLPLEISIVINWECNYLCSYCFAYKPKDKSEYRKYSGKEWEKALYSIYEKYGKCRLILTGGEPLLYKDAIDFVINLTRYHFVSVGTNLSIGKDSLKRIVDEVNIDNFVICPSLHLEYASIEEFIDKLMLLKSYGIALSTSAVAYPPFLLELSKIRDKFNENGLWIGFFPYIGTYDGRNFPSDYSEKELTILDGLDGWHKEICRDDKKIVLPKTKGILCYAGVKYMFVNPNGEVVRCTPVYQPLGNIFDNSFSLPKKPMRCPADICDCQIYWKYHVK